MALPLRILALGALLAALLLGSVAYACAAGPAAGREPLPAPPSPRPAPEGHLAAEPAEAAARAAASAGGTTSAVTCAGPSSPNGSVDILGAVVVARRVCALVDRGSLSAARWLFADGAHWPAGLWRRLRRVRFRSARVVSLRAGQAPIVHLNVRLATPASRDGLRTLAFTLGRVGTEGDWLVYAVQTPILPRERGPSCPSSHPRPAGFSAH